MASVIKTETIGNLIINQMTKEIYNSLKESGQINPYEMYLLTDGEEVDYGTILEELDKKAEKTIYTATLGTNWIGSAAPYTQTITVAGILETDNPHIIPVYSSNNETALSETQAWSMVSQGITKSGTITFTCFEEKPSVQLNLQIEVVR